MNGAVLLTWAGDKYWRVSRRHGSTGEEQELMNKESSTGVDTFGGQEFISTFLCNPRSLYVLHNYIQFS